MPDPVEKKEITTQQFDEAVGALRAEIKKAVPDKEKLEKINADLDKQEEKNQQLALSLKNAEKLSEEQKERMDAIELELAKAPKLGDRKDAYKGTPEYKAMEAYCQKGIIIPEDQKQLLRTDNDTEGGFLVMGELDNVIVKDITELDPMRSIARVRTVSAKSLEIPRRTDNMVATYEGEAEQDDLSTEKYGSETLTPFRLSVTVPITMDLLMDAAFSMESEILSDASEAFALAEGQGFVSGTGFKQPSGYISNSTLQSNSRTSSTSGDITVEDMLLLTGDLKTGYNPVYTFNRRTLALLRTKRSDAVVAADNAGEFLWQPGMNGSVENTINGFPYVIMPSMPDIAANSFSVAFGDFQRGYTITDRTGTSVIRDNITRKRQAIIEFTIHRWNTGQVIVTEAIKLLKTAA